jgi:hypothetical protein
MVRATTAESEENAHFAASLQRLDAQQRFATQRADTVVRRYSGTARDTTDGSVYNGGTVYNGGDTTRDTTGSSVYNPGTTSGSVYSEDSADYVDPAKSYTPRGGGSDRGSGSERGSERSGRQRQAVRFKPAAKKVAALSPDPVKNAPYFGRGEPPSWSPGAAKVG